MHHSPILENLMAAEKVAIVTAGAAEWVPQPRSAWLRHGFKVRHSLVSGKGEALAKELGGIGVTGSNQSNGDVKKLVDQDVSAWGRIDVLVNSAGHGPRKPILELTDEDWHKGMDVYFLSVVRPTRLVTPVMQKQKSGAIINISTAGLSNRAPCSRLRSGASWARFLHQDLCGHLCRGQHPHEQCSAWLDRQPARNDERRDSVPMKRYGTSEEIAATIAFLASPGAAYITAQNIRVDGGITRST